ncbi:zinc finger protein 474-like [Chelonus insularis]|uniref:zinc finger protein 474-like n=1 Tax=Chelonus insularis TaxID=460826 RepID=UPI0015890E69|nr:zinc finger protein 474-like [Chelonus insularis]
MKWRKGSNDFFPEKTFLIIKNNLESLTAKKHCRRIKSKSAADTGTWPPKVKKLCPYNVEERPKTANLEKPSVLDPSLVNKLDMSLLSKELLCDSMTRIQLGGRNVGGEASSNNYRSVPSSIVESKTFVLRQKRQNSEHSVTSEQFSKEPQLEPVIMKKQLPLSPSISNDRNKKVDINKKLDDNNNKNPTHGISKPIGSLSTVKISKSFRAALPDEIEVFTNSTTKIVPEPCKTCGRPDQPERFHSHPKSALPVKGSIKDVVNPNKPKDKDLKKNIQKPVALNFRSEKNKNKIKESEIEINKKAGAIADEVIQLSRPSSTKKGPRTVMCYICSREFGTASFPIHEPHCLQKWERENNSLPPSQRRPPPQRPTVDFDDYQWNNAAWELSQTQLLPCWKCGRTFLPDRLPVHQKSCKATPKNSSALDKSDRSERTRNTTSRLNLSTVFCPRCGRTFTVKSLETHETQCLKRWQVDQKIKEEQKEPIMSPRDSQKRIVNCYICGREYGSAGIDIHEPQCLKKWNAENLKLPLNQRMPEPQKPEIVLIETSTSGSPVIDWAATSEARWKSHLGQLVPCKNCKRTFNPDRVAVHERTCKGTR